MEKLKMTKQKKMLILIAIIVLIDQLTKTWIRINFNYLETITIINNFFNITYTKNTGGAWSILESIIFDYSKYHFSNSFNSIHKKRKEYY